MYLPSSVYCHIHAHCTLDVLFSHLLALITAASIVSVSVSLQSIDIIITLKFFRLILSGLTQIQQPSRQRASTNMIKGVAP